MCMYMYSNGTLYIYVNCKYSTCITEGVGVHSTGSLVRQDGS